MGLIPEIVSAYTREDCVHYPPLPLWSEEPLGLGILVVRSSIHNDDIRLKMKSLMTKMVNFKRTYGHPFKIRLFKIKNR